MKMKDIENRVIGTKLTGAPVNTEQLAADLDEMARAARALKWNTNYACVKGQISGEEAIRRLDEMLDDVMSVTVPELLDAQRTLRLYLTQERVSAATMSKMLAMHTTGDSGRDQIEAENPLIAAPRRAHGH